MTKVFISYVTEDIILITKLVNILEDYGIIVWFNKKDIKPGLRWKEAIRKAITSGDFFIACFSENYNSKLKSYMNEELTIAIEELRLRPTDRAWFIPILISECTIPDRDIGAGETIRSLQWIELYKNWSKGIYELLDVLDAPKQSKNKSDYLKKTYNEKVERIEKLYNKLREKWWEYGYYSDGDVILDIITESNDIGISQSEIRDRLISFSYKEEYINWKFEEWQNNEDNQREIKKLLNW